MKICSKCNQEKQQELFSKLKKSKDGLKSQCKDCCNEYAFNRKDDPRVKALQRKADLKRRYGITPEEYEAIWASQGYCCANQACKSTIKPHMDHCHITGKIRGILCRKCNVGQGLVGDDPRRIRGLVIYLLEARQRYEQQAMQKM